MQKLATANLIIFHGDADRNMSYEQQKPIHDKLKRLNPNIEIVIAKGAGHQSHQSGKRKLWSILAKWQRADYVRTIKQRSHHKHSLTYVPTYSMSISLRSAGSSPNGISLNGHKCPFRYIRIYRGIHMRMFFHDTGGSERWTITVVRFMLLT